MSNNKQVHPYPLRLPNGLRSTVERMAGKSRRSLNSELILLVEDGFKYRERYEKNIF
ncbi:hypothetical protein LMG33818_000881 [Halomonadaceae bacterium LMG 33818]|uniref:Arc family DNA-binding protein n=1 Tax=Cernens ardua TaxID=3402176 RepID=UPI003EDB9973